MDLKWCHRVRNKAYHGCRVSLSLHFQSIPLIVYAGSQHDKSTTSFKFTVKETKFITKEVFSVLIHVHCHLCFIFTCFENKWRHIGVTSSVIYLINKKFIFFFAITLERYNRLKVMTDWLHVTFHLVSSSRLFSCSLADACIRQSFFSMHKLQCLEPGEYAGARFVMDTNYIYTGWAIAAFALCIRSQACLFECSGMVHVSHVRGACEVTAYCSTFILLISTTLMRPSRPKR